MKLGLALLLATVAFAGITASACAEVLSYTRADLEKIHNQMVATGVAITQTYPNKQGASESTNSSGTVVDMKIHNDDCVHYVLTTEHGIDDSYDATSRTMRGGIRVYWQMFDQAHMGTDTVSRRAVVVRVDDRLDVALLRFAEPVCNSSLRSAYVADSTAVVLPGQQAWLVSAVLGGVDSILLLSGNITTFQMSRYDVPIVGFSTSFKPGQSGGGGFIYDNTCECFVLVSVLQRTTPDHSYSNEGISTQELVRFLDAARAQILDNEQ